MSTGIRKYTAFIGVTVDSGINATHVIIHHHKKFVIIYQFLIIPFEVS